MRGGSFGCTYENVSARVCECIPLQTFKWRRINTHTRWICTQMYALAHNMNMYSLTFRSEHTAIHTDGTYCIVHRHTFTHRALPVTDVGRNIARKKALSFLFILSVFWHAYLGTQCGHVTEAVSFLFQFLCARFFFPPYVIIMKLKSFVPRKIRRDSGKARGTLAKIFLSVMS